MSKQPFPLDKPTRKGVEQLLRQLMSFGREWESPDYLEYQRLSQELANLQSKLFQNPRYKRLKARKDKAYTRYHDRRNAIREEAVKIHRQFLAKGLTPEVHRSLLALVKKAEQKTRKNTGARSD